MKFRAVMEDPQYMREFQNIIGTLAKLTKECVMKITADTVFFIANEEFSSSAPLVWVEIESKLYFNEYQMEGIDTACHCIMLSVSAHNLGRAMSVLRHNTRYCKFKLTNIQFPCLTIESDVVSQSSEQSRQILHDVPVSVIPRSDWAAYAVPQKPDANIILNVPSNRLMRNLIDKVKNLSPTIIFYATSGGEMNIVAETEMATITTRYKNLEVVRALNSSNTNARQQTKKDKAKEQQHNRDNENVDGGRDGGGDDGGDGVAGGSRAGLVDASCSVDCKKAALFFSALQVPTLELSCGIEDDHLIHMEVNVRQGVAIHSILPAVCV